jgi:hypothetical protein
MKIYQVYSGEEDKHGFQREYYVATYVSKEKALEHCERIVEGNKVGDDEILEEVEGSWGKHWDAIGWSRVTICALYEREVNVEV